MVIRLVINDLWGEVLGGSAASLATIVGVVDGPSKVGKLDVSTMINQDVLGLNIPMKDVVLV